MARELKNLRAGAKFFWRDFSGICAPRFALFSFGNFVGIPMRTNSLERL
ncbi:DUF1661 domain-containing protein [Porphyromonas gulae]